MSVANAILEKAGTALAIRRVGAAVGALLLGAAIVLVRGGPILNYDQGVFLSIAARMLDGDHLYSQVIDNKDPLFFYTYAAALKVGGWRGPFALDAIWLAVASVSFALMLRELRVPRNAVLAGFFLYPLCLTIGWYEPGLAMLGALAFAPVVGWLWLRGSFVAAGAALGVVVLLTLGTVLVAAAPLAAYVLLGTPPGARVRQIARATLGAVSTLGAAAAVLALRGELGGYFDVLAYDLSYKDEGLAANGKRGGVVGHLEVALEFFGGVQAAAAAVVLAVFLVAVYVLRTRGGAPFRNLSAAAIVTFVATVGTLALTAIWPHHLQVLAYPMAFIAAVLIVAATHQYGQRAGAVAAVGCVLFFVLASAKAEAQHRGSHGDWFATPHSATAAALETARIRFYPGAHHVTYMIFGQNTENAHAVFITDAFDLTCRRFHQYPHDPEKELSRTLACVQKTSPMLIVETKSLFYDPSRTPQWQSFVSGTQSVLASRYTRVSDAAGVQVWKRRELSFPELRQKLGKGRGGRP